MKKVLLVSLILSTASAFAMENIPNAVNEEIPTPEELALQNLINMTLENEEAIDMAIGAIGLLENTNSSRTNLINLNTAPSIPLAQGNMPRYTTLLTNSALFKNIRLTESLLQHGARVDIPDLYLLGAAIEDVVPTHPNVQRCHVLATLLYANAPLSSLINSGNGQFFIQPEMINPNLLAFLLIYLAHHGKLEELNTMRDRNGRTMLEYLRQYEWHEAATTVIKEPVLHLLANSERASVLYPEVEREFTAYQRLRRDDILHRIGPKTDPAGN